MGPEVSLQLLLFLAIVRQSVTIGLISDQALHNRWGDMKCQVSLRYTELDTPFGEGHLCGGSLIRRDLVLTTASCVHNKG